MESQNNTKIMEAQNDTKICPFCGETIKIGAKKCRFCNEWLEEPPMGYFPTERDTLESIDGPSQAEPYKSTLTDERPTQSPTAQNNNAVTINYEPPAHNGVGVAGFVLSLISLILSWVPGVGWIVWFLGLLLSFFGVFKKPRGLAIVGLLVSLIDIFILLAIVGAVSTIF